MYGRGVQQHKPKARELIKQAAAEDNPWGLYFLGWFLETGDGMCETFLLLLFLLLLVLVLVVVVDVVVRRYW